MARARILVVEDQGLLAEDIRVSLQELGYEVCAVAKTGEKAIALAQREKPDLVLMNIVLQGKIDGIEAANRIHAELQIPIIYLTAHSDEEILSRAKAAEPYGFLIKPFHDSELYCTIEIALVRHKKTEAELRNSKEALEAYSSSLEQMVVERTEDLEKSRLELARYSESLEKTNKALRILIEGIEQQKKEVEKNITHHLNLTVKPILDQLKAQETGETVGFLLKSLEFNLTNMFSSFGFDIVKTSHLLTPRELRVCEMVRSGLSSKQIAKVMAISPQTVLVHRKNIRKKLALARSRRNLASFLRSNPL